MRKIIIFVLLFCAFYFEMLSINDILLSHLWKLPLLLYAVLYIVFTKKISRNNFSKYGYLWGIKNIFNFGISKFFMLQILNVIKSFNLVVIYNFFLIKYNKNQLKNIITFLSYFIILSGIPFELGILKSIGDQYVVESGFDVVDGFVGVFQGPHYASLMLTMSILNLIHFYSKSNNKYVNIFKYAIIILGLFFLIKTFARTGYLAFILGYIGLKYNKRKVTNNIGYLLIISFVFIILLFNSESLYNRVFNKTENSDETIQSFSSQRTLFWNTNLVHWTELDLEEKFFGIGRENSIIYMKEKTGFSVVSHNGFIDALIQNGLIGVFVFLMMIYCMVKIKTKSKEDSSFKRMVFLTFVSVQLTQGGYFFGFDLMIGLNLAYISNNKILSITN